MHKVYSIYYKLHCKRALAEAQIEPLLKEERKRSMNRAIREMSGRISLRYSLGTEKKNE